MARGTNYSIIFGIIILGLFGSAQIAFAGPGNPYTLTNAPGEGTVTIGVDGFGGFGSFSGPDATDAFYDPIDSIPNNPAKTTLASAIAIRSGGSGVWSFLTSGSGIFGSGGLPNPTVAGTPTFGTSSFSSNGLNFNLVQTLTKTFSGTTLTQTYTISNPNNPNAMPTPSPIDIDLLRYFDGDLFFDGSINDGGGRLINLAGIEILFETDALGTSSTFSTFVGITTDEGTEPTTNKFEINKFPNLGSNIVFVGNPLGNLVFNDSPPPELDEFIDIALYDVSLALSSDGFSIGAGESVVYVTKTVFGDGAPEDVEIDPPTEEEFVGGTILPIETMALLLAGAQFNAFFILSTLALTGSFAFGVLYYKTKRVN